jgi:SNF2 family DNA or RNA helicase
MLSSLRFAIRHLDSMGTAHGIQDVTIANAIAVRQQLLPYSVDLAIAGIALPTQHTLRDWVEAMMLRNPVIDPVDPLDRPFSNGWALKDHQKDAVRWARTALANYRGVILALDMGLGKTITSLVIAKESKLPVMVVAPASLLENWRREAAIAGVEITAHSWGSVPAPPAHEFFAIFDEAHYAQSGEGSQRGERFLALAESPWCRGAIALTGTPIKNAKPVHLFPLLRMTGHPIAHDQRAYEIRYCAARCTTRSPWDTSGSSHLDELSQAIKPVVYRLRKDRVLADLPPKTRVMVPVKLSPSAELVWREAVRRAQIEFSFTGNDQVRTGRLRLAASVAKRECAIALAQKILGQGDSVILFTEYESTAIALSQALGGELLIGSVPKRHRQAMVDRFQSRESCIFVATSGAGGVGITLTAAHHVIMVDRPWTPGDLAQCEDRAHRIGQTNPVTSYWLQFGEDEDRDRILERKQFVIDDVLDRC